MREFLKRFGDFWVKKDYKDNNIDIFAEECFKSYGLNLVDIQHQCNQGLRNIELH